MAIDPDRLKELTTGVVGAAEKRRTNSEARMAAFNAAAPNSKTSVKVEDEGPAGDPRGMGQIATETRGRRPKGPEESAEGLTKVGGKWVNTSRNE